MIASAPPLLCLLGPTAVGKTGVTEALIGEPVEIVSADSMQVYRGLDIGTAKPDASLVAALPHHLINIIEPHQAFDVGSFVARAEAAIAETLRRGRVPVVVGGTGYYVKHLLMGLPEVPRSDAGIRSRLEEELTELGSAAMRARLGRIDPASAERIPESDTYRTLRALEVYEQTGSPLSSFKREGGVRRDFSVTVFELTRARSELHQRIKLRVEKMFERGLRVEVERLVAGGGAADWPAMRAIGYREFFDTAGCVRPRNQDAEIMNEIKTATRRYAKRQITFCNQFLNRVQMHADDVAGVLAVVRRAVAALDSV